MSNNQDYALARWREDSARSDPVLYTIAPMHGGVCAWLSIAGNVGWWRMEVVDSELVGLRSIALPAPDSAETAEERAVRNYAFKLFSPKARTKLMQAYAERSPHLTNSENSPRFGAT